MTVLVVMPKLGLTMTEGTLVRWLADLGDVVRQGQPLCEIETDKITIEVESPGSGTLLRRSEAGAPVPVGVGIAVIGEPGEDPTVAVLHGDGDGAPAATESEAHGSFLEGAGGAVVPVEASAAGATGDAQSHADGERSERSRDSVSPVARRVAAELGVDLRTVRGTGPGGRIVRRDVEEAAGGPPPGG